MEPHQLNTAQVAAQIKTNIIIGLTQQDAQQRLQQYGANELLAAPTPSWFIVFLSQFQSPLIYILLMAAGLMLVVAADLRDSFIIVAVLLVNAIIGMINEGRTRSILESLKRFVKTETVVVRDGTKKIVEDVHLVPGDVIILQAGNRVPADARLVEAHNLLLDEAVLTGESAAVLKNDEPVADEALFNERTNMVYKGTYILSGLGRAIVLTTGNNTVIGKVQKLATPIDLATPLKKEIIRLSYWILLGILVLCCVLFVVGILTHRSLYDLLITLTVLAVSVVPEGLPIVFTLVLVMGAYRLATQKILVKNMHAVETLGHVDTILTDKTGTLTRNEMIVEQMYVDGMLYKITGTGYHVTGQISKDGVVIEDPKKEAPLAKIAIAINLLNSTEIVYNAALDVFTVKGDPTEASLFVFAQKVNPLTQDLRKKYVLIDEIPFNQRTRYHAGMYTYDGKVVAFLIGSPELLLERSVNNNTKAQEALDAMLQQGLRMVGVATKELAVRDIPEHESKRATFFENTFKDGLSFLGFCGIQDSIRPQSQQMVTQAKSIGIRVVMVTGDHKKTAVHVAERVGIYSPGDRIVDGAELMALSDEELIRQINLITVYSRVSPEQKLRILKLFHRLGRKVAMTGDGVNDAPALVAADVGVAMGSIGSEVAKEAADLVLMEDSFEYLIKAIEQGKHVAHTLRRVILYLFSTNLSEVFVIFFSFVLNVPLPITAVQILWLNVVTDGFLDIGLSMEAQEKNILKKTKTKIIDRQLFIKMLYGAAIMTVGSLWIFDQFYKEDLILARTLTLVTMAMYQWFNAWNCRSENLSIFQLGLFTNLLLLCFTSLVLLLQLLMIYAPFMQRIFNTVPLSAGHWGLILVVTAPIIVLEEIRKLVVQWWYSK